MFLKQTAFEVNAVVHDLHDNWYSVTIFTNNKNQYDTFKSRATVDLIPHLNEEELTKAGAFDNDIFVAALRDDKNNYNLAKMAKKAGVNRVIAILMQPDVDTVNELQDEGIEIFNFSNVRAALLRALIETPSVYQVITDTKNILYSVRVRNTKYTGTRLMDWDFIDQITISRIRRDGTWLAPHGTTVIEPGDIIIFSGKFEAADKIRQTLSKR